MDVFELVGDIQYIKVKIKDDDIVVYIVVFVGQYYDVIGSIFIMMLLEFYFGYCDENLDVYVGGVYLGFIDDFVGDINYFQDLIFYFL